MLLLLCLTFNLVRVTLNWVEFVWSAGWKDLYSFFSFGFVVLLLMQNINEINWILQPETWWLCVLLYQLLQEPASDVYFSSFDCWSSWTYLFLTSLNRSLQDWSLVDSFTPFSYTSPCRLQQMTPWPSKIVNEYSELQINLYLMNSIINQITNTEKYFNWNLHCLCNTRYNPLRACTK